MIRPTTDDFRNWTQLKLAQLGYGEDTKLQPVLDRAIGYVLYVSGQKLDALDTSLSPTAAVEDMEPLIGQAIQMRAEQVILQGRPGHVGSAADNEVVSSISVGSYSESRRAPGFSRSGVSERSINTWPALEEILWMVMTPERYGYWWAFTSGKAIPDFWVEEMAWVGGGSALSWFEPWDRYVVGSESF